MAIDSSDWKVLHDDTVLGCRVRLVCDFSGPHFLCDGPGCGSARRVCKHARALIGQMLEDTETADFLRLALAFHPGGPVLRPVVD